ncbi:hypothetical protein AB0I24_07215 [Brachybacterium paraconglomeratum]
MIRTEKFDDDAPEPRRHRVKATGEEGVMLSFHGMGYARIPAGLHGGRNVNVDAILLDSGEIRFYAKGSIEMID